MRCSLAALLVLAVLSPAHAEGPRKTQNLIVVTIDGLRYQELFSGADDVLIDPKHGGVRDVKAVKKQYWFDDHAARRETLMPFFWKSIAREGQVFGDPLRKAPAVVTNAYRISYPGYSEMFCGFADRRIVSNDRRNNPNPSVLEFLNEKPTFKDRIAAFCTWDLFPFIFRDKRNGLKVHSGWSLGGGALTERQRLLKDLATRLPRIWPDNIFDAPVMEAALEHLRRDKPRVLFVGLGETDEWAHARRYDLYLDAARQSDRFLAELWAETQKMPSHAGKTTLLVLTDHGRGPTRENWTDHNRNVPDAEKIWIAVLGPDTPPLAERENVATTQSQVAASIAHLLGEDYNAYCPKAAPPLPGIVRGRK